MLVSYWDGGYVELDVTDPTRARYVADSDFANPDPELARAVRASRAARGQRPPVRVHARQPVRHRRRRGLQPDRVSRRAPTTGGSFARRRAAAIARSARPATRMSGRTRYVGRACDGDPPCRACATRPVRGRLARRLRVHREDRERSSARGYDAAIVVNREGFDGCGPFGMTVEGGIPAFAVERSVGFGLVRPRAGTTTSRASPGRATLLPDAVGLGEQGDIGHAVARSSTAGATCTSSQRRRASSSSSTRTRSPRRWIRDFAEGFGDLSVHEVATSPTSRTTRLPLVLRRGVRVLEIEDRRSSSRSASFIDVRAEATSGACRCSATAARSTSPRATSAYGLYIFRYTG